MGRHMAVIGAIAALTLGTSPVARAQELPPDGWLVFEHFGQAPDGSTPELDFDRRQVWLAHPDGSDLHELSPGMPTHGKASPDVSPDGARVAFNTWRPLSRVWEVGIDGDGLRLVSEDCSGRDGDCQEWDPAYAADGRRIAFVHVGWEGGAGYTEIGIRDLAGGPPTYLASTRVPLDEGDLAQPSWSPDGTRIAYHRNGPWVGRAGGNDYPASIRVWTVRADGSGAQELATPAGIDAADADWSPDGTRIVYATAGYRESEGVGDLGALHVHAIGADGTDDRILAEGWAPTWLSDEQVMFWGFRTWSVVDADGTDEHPIDRAHLTWFADGLGYGYFATWTAAKEEPPIAYQGASSIHTVRPDGTHDTTLPGLPPSARHMDWSPDGRQLAFYADDAQDGGLTGDIWIVGADGSDPRLVADCRAPCSWFDAPAWAPDGRSIAYVRYDVTDGHFPGSTVEVLDLTTGAVATIASTTTPEFVNDMRWSPDGTRLVLGIGTYIDPDNSNDVSGSHLAIVDLADDPKVVDMLETVGLAGYPDWHPTDDVILFQAGTQDPEWLRAGLLDMYTVRPDGTGLTLLRKASEDDPVVWMPTWSADGESILVTLTDRASGDHTLARLSRDGSTLEQLPGPVYGAHPRQARSALP